MYGNIISLDGVVLRKHPLCIFLAVIIIYLIPVKTPRRNKHTNVLLMNHRNTCITKIDSINVKLSGTYILINWNIAVSYILFKPLHNVLKR